MVLIEYDQLVFYAALLLFVALIVRLVYGIYCKRNFEECSVYLLIDKSVVKEMMGFAGWNYIGASSGILRDQGVNILINLFCGPVVNAARGIAFQVNAAVGSFVTNFMTALNPQITKSYASGNMRYLFMLVCQGARFSFYLLFFLSLPILLETHTVLSIWLGEVPDHTVLFVQLILISTLSESLSGTLITAMLATGKIRNYQLIVGGLLMLNFPISYMLLYFGGRPEYTLLVSISLTLCCLLARLLMLRSMIGLSIRRFLKTVVMNVSMVSIVACIIPLGLRLFMEEGGTRFLIICILCGITTIFSIYFLGCSKEERFFLSEKISSFKNKIMIKISRKSWMNI